MPRLASSELERAAGQTFLPTTEKLKWSPCVVKDAANNFDTSVAATYAAPGNDRAAIHVVRLMDLADSRGQALANRSTGVTLTWQFNGIGVLPGSGRRKSGIG